MKAITDREENRNTSLKVANGSIISKLSTRSSFIGNSKFNITVQNLNQSRTVVESFKKTSTGLDVLNYVCNVLHVYEKEYFGFQYEDNKFCYWVDLTKPLWRQFHHKNVSLRFRIRFYPSEPLKLKEPVTKYYLYLQLCRDLLHGRLICSQDDAANLAGLILQANLGDYNVNEMGLDADYVSSYNLLMKQSPKSEEKIWKAHMSYSGLSVEQAETEFLNIASKLESYGFNPYNVKDLGQTQELVIGASHVGIFVFVKNQKIHTIDWSYIEKIDYITKQLIVNISKSYTIDSDLADNSLLKKSTLDKKNKTKENCLQLKVICPSAIFAKNLWRHLLSQQAFFTEDHANSVKLKFSKPRIPLFLRGSTFCCPTPRVFREIVQDTSLDLLDNKNDFERCTLERNDPRSVVEPWNVNRSRSFDNSEKPLDTSILSNKDDSDFNNTSNTYLLNQSSLLDATENNESKNESTKFSENEKNESLKNLLPPNKFKKNIKEKNAISNKVLLKKFYLFNTPLIVSSFLLIFTAIILLAFFVLVTLSPIVTKWPFHIYWPEWLFFMERR